MPSFLTTAGLPPVKGIKMSPENASAVSVAEETVPATPETSTQTLSRESMAEMMANRDSKALDEAIKATMNPAPPEPETPSAETPAPETQEPPVAGTPPDENSDAKGKIFTINYQGETVEIPDDDSYLGEGSFGKLKKRYAHTKRTLEGYEERVRNYRAEADRVAAEKSELQQRYEDAQAKLKSFQERPPEPKVEQPTTPPPAETPPPSAPKFEMPNAPVYPELPLEPENWTTEDAVRFKDYQVAKAAYDKKIAELLPQLASRPAPQAAPAQYRNDPALEKQVKEMSEFIQSQKLNQQKVEHEQKLKGFWDGLREFQNLHSEELGTPEDVQTLHTKIQNWMDGVAWANGVQQPANADKLQQQQYQAAKKAIVDKYLKNDPTVRANSEGTPAPNGYENYFKLAEYQEQKNALINKGVLGPNASLQDAWKHLYTEKDLSEDINALEASARSEGSNAVLQNLQKHQKNDAITIPNSVAASSSEPEAPIRISQEEAQQILQTPPQQLLADPELKRKFDYLVANVKPK